jgi:hypothetical protein
MYDDDQQPGPAVASFHDKQATSSGISDCSPDNGEQASKRLRLRKVQNTDNNGHDNESASLRTRLRILHESTLRRYIPVMSRMSSSATG